MAYYQRAIGLDQYLAIAYFQQGVSNFLMGDFEEALANFNDTLLYLRGNRFIDYDQLGLKFKLYSCEALFNRGLCFIYLMQTDAGMEDLKYAAKEKDVPDHDVIDEAIKEKAEGYTVFSIPVGRVFRPSEAKVKNVRTRDYLGKARLVAAANPDGPANHRNVSHDTWARDDRPIGQLSYAATQLVKPNMASRSHPTRQQSEPPINRNVFPPTPPPEDHGSAGHMQRAYTFDAGRRAQSPNRMSTATTSTVASVRSHSSTRQKPQALDLRAAGSNLATFERQERPPPNEQARRRAPARAQSERPTESRRQYSDDGDRRGQNAHDDFRYLNYKPSSDHGLFGSVDADFDPRRVQADSGRSQQTSAGSQEHNSLHEPRQRHRSASRSQTFPRQGRGDRHDLIEEETEEEAQAEAGRDSGSEYGSAAHRLRSSASTLRLPVRSSSRAPSVQHRHAQPEVQDSPRLVQMKKIRIKAHGPGDDTRYVMAPSTILYAEFLEAIAKKFSLSKSSMKVKTRDEEGDLITMGDQDDLDMAVAAAKEAAGREAVDMGKLEVWVSES